MTLVLTLEVYMHTCRVSLRLSLPYQQATSNNIELLASAYQGTQI